MPDISAKGKAVPDSPIRKLAPFANAATKRGTHVIHLNIGQPDIATPEVAMDAVRNLDRTVLEYSPSEGFARVPGALGGLLQRSRSGRDGR